jgi:Chaperone of endosialidase
MPSACASLTLVLVLTLGLAVPVAAQPVSGPEYIPLETPCRALDTRGTGTPIPANVPTTIQISGVCGVPPTAVGAALNFTITEPQGAGWMTTWSSGALPLASVVNFVAGETVANAVDIGFGAGGTVLVQPVAITHLVVDIYGYFTDVEELPGFNTAVGVNALADITTGLSNTALGANALLNNSVGDSNTALGAETLANNTSGDNNTATGNFALSNNFEGTSNTATGDSALVANTTGDNNTATGRFALNSNVIGSNNIAIGFLAGTNVITGSNNIYIGNVGGSPAESTTIRLGTDLIQTSTSIAGIFGQPVGAGAAAVMIDNTGKLGTVSSTRRVKVGIHDMDTSTNGLLRLRPVTFRYIAGHADGGSTLQYGLIAEEVAEIYPELVVLDKDGQPAGVRYHILPAMLLNELQRQDRERHADKAQTAAGLAAQQEELNAQARLIEELTARLSRLEVKGTSAVRR